MNALRWLGYAAILALGAALLALVGLLWWGSYPELVELILRWSGKPSLRAYLEQRIFPESRLGLLRGLATAGVGLYAIWALFAFRRMSGWAARGYYLAGYARAWVGREWAAWRGLPRLERGAMCAVLCAVFARSVYNLLHFELQYDEAWTYNHFVSNGFLFSAASPHNNHPLYTLVACAFDYLPLSGKYALRLPTWLAGWAALAMGWALLRRVLPRRAAVLAWATWAVSTPLAFYMLYARGYMFMIFFGLWALLALWELWQQPNNCTIWAGFVVASVGAMYSIPSYLLAAVAAAAPFAVGWALRRDGAAMRLLAGALVKIAVCTAILYLPFLLTNGLRIVADSAAQKAAPALGWEAIYFYGNWIADWLFWGAGAFAFWVVWALSAAALWGWWQGRRLAASLILLNIWLPTVWFASTLMWLPERIWCFVPFFAAWAWGEFGRKPTESRAGFVGLGLASVALVGWISQTHYFLHWSAELDREALRVSDLLVQNHVNECFSFARYDKPLLEYYLLRANGRRARVYMPFAESQDYQDFSQRAYESVLWDKEDYRPTAADSAALAKYPYRKAYENSRIVVYLRN